MDRELMIPPFYDNDRHMKAYHMGCTGMIGVASYGPGHGVGWAYLDPDGRRINAHGRGWRGWRGAEVIIPSDEYRGRWEIPATVHAYCPRCGHGEVSTEELLRKVRLGKAKAQLDMKLTPRFMWLRSTS